MKFLDIIRELALGFGIALLIPIVTHYIALVIHPRPAFPTEINSYTKVEEQKNNPDVILFKEQRVKSDTIYLYVTFIMCIITLIFRNIYFFCCNRNGLYPCRTHMSRARFLYVSGPFI